MTQTLLPEWKLLLRRAWSIRFSVLSAVFIGAETAVPLLDGMLPRGLFVSLSFASSVGATLARLVAQPEMHK